MGEPAGGAAVPIHFHERPPLVLTAAAADMRVWAGGSGLATGGRKAVSFSVPCRGLFRTAGRAWNAAALLVRDAGLCVVFMATRRAGQIIVGHGWSPFAAIKLFAAVVVLYIVAHFNVA